MAFTIAQLQAFSNTKPELRYLTEEIIDYLEANPGGGGGSGIVETIVAGSGIAVDATDPANPEVSATGGVTIPATSYDNNTDAEAALGVGVLYKSTTLINGSPIILITV